MRKTGLFSLGVLFAIAWYAGFKLLHVSFEESAMGLLFSVAIMLVGLVEKKDDE